MKRDELIALLQQYPNEDVAFVVNVWSPMGGCYDRRMGYAQVQHNDNPSVIVVTVTPA